MDSINKYLHFNRIEVKDTKVLDEAINKILEEYPSLKEKYQKVLSYSNYSSLKPWLLKTLKDQVPCQNCNNYFSCPKQGRRGYYYELDEEKEDIINKMCIQKININKYRPHLIFGEETYDDVFSVYFQMREAQNEILNPKTEFFKIASTLMKAIKSGSSFQFYLNTNNENNKILAYFAAATTLTKKMNTIIIDPSLRLNFLRLDNQESMNEVLELQRKINDAKVIIIENFDTFKRYSQTLDNLVLPLIKASTTKDKILILTGEDEFDNTITPLSNYSNAKPHSLISKRLNEIITYNFDEPVFYKIK